MFETCCMFCWCCWWVICCCCVLICWPVGLVICCCGMVTMLELFGGVLLCCLCCCCCVFEVRFTFGVVDLCGFELLLRTWNAEFLLDKLYITAWRLRVMGHILPRVFYTSLTGLESPQCQWQWTVWKLCFSLEWLWSKYDINTEHYQQELSSRTWRWKSIELKSFALKNFKVAACHVKCK